MKEFVVASDWPWGLEAVLSAREALRRGSSALDAVENAVKIVEDNPNATSVGTGGLPNAEGELELDASIMDGTELRAGAVACLKRTRNPISVARKVMDLTPHVLLAGDGAVRFARRCGFPDYDPLTPEARRTWKKLRGIISSQDVTTASKRFSTVVGYDANIDGLARALRMVYADYLGGTVGVLARDREGRIAAGTSTSGLAMRIPGRVADSGIIGAGNYASRSAAATATGVGELAIKHGLTKSVCDLVEGGSPPTEACERALIGILAREEVPHMIAVVCIDKDCNVGGACTKPGFQFEYMTSRSSRPVIVHPRAVLGRRKGDC